MPQHSVLVLWFVAGITLQALLLIRGSWNWAKNWPKLAGCALLALTGMIPGKHEPVYDPWSHLLFGLGMFSFAFAIVFKDDILPRINERILLSYSLVFWFALFSFFDGASGFRMALLAICGALTAVSLFVAFVRPTLSFALKVALYVWFLTIVVAVGLFQFPIEGLSIFLEPNRGSWLAPVDCILGGMAFLYLVVNASYIFELIPIPGKTQSWKDRMKEWHAFTDLMTNRIDDEPPTATGAIIIVLGQGSILLSVYFYHWLDAGLVINVFVVLPFLLRLKRQPQPRAAARR